MIANPDDWEDFAETVARTGKVWAHPDTIAKIFEAVADAPQIRLVIDINTIEFIGLDAISPGCLYAFEPKRFDDSPLPWHHEFVGDSRNRSHATQNHRRDGRRTA